MKGSPSKGHSGAALLFRLIDVGLCLLGAGRTGKKIRSCLDVVYDEARDLKGDIFYPENAGKHPVFVNIHGGGFMAGDKAQRRRFCAEVARSGYLVFNVNYTTCNKAPAPDFLSDVLRAIDYITRNAERYGADASRIVIGGDSAGAFIAFLVGVVLECREYYEVRGIHVPDTRASGLVMTCGLYSFEKAIGSKIIFNLQDSVCSAVVGGDVNAPWTDDMKNRLELLEPLNVLNAPLPPCFVSETMTDVFCKGQAEPLVKKLKELGTDVTHVVEDRAIHCWHLLPTKRARRLLDKLKDFLIGIK